MLQQFYPDHEADSAYGIDYKTLYRKGYRGIIFDIDEALAMQKSISEYMYDVSKALSI